MRDRFLGVDGNFFSLGLWAADDLKTYSTALVFVQCSANALQLAAIFNDGRIPAENIREKRKRVNRRGTDKAVVVIASFSYFFFSKQ